MAVYNFNRIMNIVEVRGMESKLWNLSGLYCRTKNSVNNTGEETFGMLFFADISEFSNNLTNEIELVKLFDKMPTEWTYPEIQPHLISEYQKREKVNRLTAVKSSLSLIYCYCGIPVPQKESILP